MATNPITREQMINAATDAETLESVVNDAPGVVVTRKGRQIKTVSKVIQDLDATTTTAVTARNEAVEAKLAAQAARDASATSAAGAAASQTSASASATAAANSAAAAASGILGKQTKALLDADLAHAADKIAYVTNDATEDNNGYYIKLGASGAGSWQKSSYNVKNQIVQMGRLLRNSGAKYPFKQMTRAGITSAEEPKWSNLILDVRVVNARKDEYYQIAYMQNEASLDGETKFDWIIQKFDKATFASVDSATILVGYQGATYGPQEQLVRDGTVQTISLYPYTRPEMRFDITVDTSKLPTAGGPINSYGSNAYSGWSWIIDPSCYHFKDDTVLRTNGGVIPNANLPASLTLDQGEAYPNKQMTRNGVLTGSPSFLLDCILKVRVKGAREGYYYGIRYFKNGTTLLPGPADGWIIEEQAISTYATTDSATRVVTYTDAAPDIPRGGIQTVRIVSPRNPGMEFYITLDTDKLPAYESYISMLVSPNAGWSWIIDPSCYEYGAGSNTVSDTLSYSSDSAGNMALIWQSGSYLYRLRFGPNGYNDLPNIEGINYAPLGDRSSAAWTQINTAGTDWLPPMVVQAVNNGDSGGQIYTGGNHGADGGAGGGQTARNILYKILVDGQPMAMGAGFNGDANKVTAIIVNELMAYNTITLSRYVLRQSFMVDIRPGSVEVKTEVRAYEDIVVKTDNGPQMVTTGFQGTMLYVGGQYENRFAFDSTTVSGQFSSYPDCWALVLQSAAGQQVSWMDRDYEAGDGRYIGGTASAIRGGGATNTKFYHAAVASYSLNMAAGQKYKWRGGYAWQAPDLNGTNFDSLITFHKGGEQCTAIVKSASNYTILP